VRLVYLGKAPTRRPADMGFAKDADIGQTDREKRSGYPEGIDLQSHRQKRLEVRDLLVALNDACRAHVTFNFPSGQRNVQMETRARRPFSKDNISFPIYCEDTEHSRAWPIGDSRHIRHFAMFLLLAIKVVLTCPLLIITGSLR